MKISRSIGKSLFVLLTVILSIGYAISLIAEIKAPTSNDLQTNDFIIMGIFLLILIFINLKWVFGLFERKESRPRL